MGHDTSFQAGKLIVIGKNTIEIPLNSLPHHVKVHFKKIISSPCDYLPHHGYDKLEWEVHKRTIFFNSISKYRLVIKWDVSNVREIMWLADY